MFAMSIEDVIDFTVCSSHAGKNSERAAGVLNADEYLRLDRPTKALHLAFDVRCSFFAYKNSPGTKEADTARGVQFLFHRPIGNTGFCSTYTFAATTDSPFARRTNPTGSSSPEG